MTSVVAVDPTAVFVNDLQQVNTGRAAGGAASVPPDWDVYRFIAGLAAIATAIGATIAGLTARANQRNIRDGIDDGNNRRKNRAMRRPLWCSARRSMAAGRAPLLRIVLAM